MYSQQPPAPQPNRSNNSVLITVIICATVIVLLVLGFLLYKALIDNDKNDEPTQEKVENVHGADTAPTATPAAQANKVTTLDVPEGDVKPVRKTGSLSNVGFTDDYSDIVCYNYLTDADLRGLSKSQLRILRNTIYARHGRKFKSKDLQNYFNGFSWYTPRYDEISPSSLSAVEKHNIQLIQRYE